jgi:hypothetical protein
MCGHLLHLLVASGFAFPTWVQICNATTDLADVASQFVQFGTAVALVFC